MNTIGQTQTKINAAAGSQQQGAAAKDHFFRSSADYLANALREGFKQNFLGYDIDMDFVMISVRSFAQTSGKSLKQLVDKYSAAGRRVIEKRSYHSNTTLSHS